MNASIIKSTLLALGMLAGTAAVNASGSLPISEMSATDIISMLPLASPVEKVGCMNGATIQVSGEDLLTKAYGTISNSNSSAGAIESAEAAMNLKPERENDYLWLDCADGYHLEYNGMTPDVSALVRLENDSISEYGFFFLFPYDGHEKESVNKDQTAFSSAMLDEFVGLGVDLGANAYTEDLFEVNGDYSDNFMAMRLIDDKDGERYILLLSVEPNSISELDRMSAE